MAWTEQRIEMLKDLWAKGKTGGEIAEELGGVSRNGVVGKAHRLGLQRRPSPNEYGLVFDRVFDRVVYAPLGEPVSIEQAALAEGMNPTVALAHWTRKIVGEMPGWFLK